MTSRKELVSIIANTINQYRLDGFTSGELAVAILDKVEEKIRADEREQMKRELWPMIGAAEADVRADLRVKVQGMWLTSDTDHDYNDGYEAAKREFLDILDGSSE